jgi:hypothetical protein
MNKKLQYTGVFRNIIIYKHNNILNILTILYFNLVMTLTRCENSYKRNDGLTKITN